MNHNNSIVIIEDDIDDQQILQDIFTDLKIDKKLIFFEDGEAAFNYLMSIPDKPFIIISDINMPKMNGLDLKKKIDETDYLRMKAIPFVFLTTSDSEMSINEAYRKTSLQGYFKKMNTLPEIRQKIQMIHEYWMASLQPH